MAYQPGHGKTGLTKSEITARHQARLAALEAHRGMKHTGHAVDSTKTKRTTASLDGATISDPHNANYGLTPSEARENNHLERKLNTGHYSKAENLRYNELNEKIAEAWKTVPFSVRQEAYSLPEVRGVPKKMK